jgi:hypothetical protein
MMKPTVGRIVHYTGINQSAYEGPIAALVVFVADAKQSSRDPEENGMPLVNLVIFLQDGSDASALKGVEFSKEPKPGYWSWPPRV